MRSYSLVFPVLAGLLPAVYADQAVIHSLKIEGTARQVELETRAGEPLSPDRLTRDVRKLWATGAFEDVRVEQSDTPQGTDVVFRVTEKPRLYLREVKFAKGSEKRKVDIKQGGLIDEASAQQLANGIRKQFQQEGYVSPKVDVQLIRAGAQQADLELNLASGPHVHVQNVRFTGDLKIDRKELRGALRGMRARTMIPGIWTQHAPYSDEAVQTDLARLRSVYLLRGFFDADIRLDNVNYRGRKADVTVAVAPGDVYGVRQVDILSTDNNELTASGLKGPFPERDLCACLLGMRDKAEKEGRLDFDVRLDAEPSDEDAMDAAAGGPQKWLDLTASIQTGPPYRVGRIEFRGNHSFSESTLRRAMLLDEAAILDVQRLRQSMVRLSQLGVFEPVATEDVEIRRNAAKQRADIIINLKQKPRGGWSFSGPVGPVSLAGPLQASIASRLPGWGKGIFETSTYFLTFSALGFPSTFTRFIPFMPNKQFIPLLILERPYLPGQGLLSGFAVSPSLGWRPTALTYGMSQTRHLLHAALGSDKPIPPELVIPVERKGSDADKLGTRYLVCEQRRSGWSKVKAGATFATDLVLGQRPF